MVSRRLLAQTVAAQLIERPSDRAKIMQAAAAYLVDHNMAAKADLFINDLAYEIQHHSGQLTAEVVSANPLPDKVLDDLKTYLKSATGAKDVSLQVSQDPALLGGFVARTADAEIDKSVQHQLSQLRGIA